MAWLVGLISRKQKDVCSHNLKSMLVSMKCENFYNSGSYFNEDMGIYLGWMSHKKAFDDCMPISNENGSAILFFSGEVYPEREKINELERRGHKISPDANYLVHLYEEVGGNFIEELNGHFSGILIDQTKKECFIFNDRYGMNRLFMFEKNEELYFASNARSLLAALPEARYFDPEGLAEYLVCGCTLGTRSLYAGINVFPAASSWTIKNGRVEKRRIYFKRSDWELQERLCAEVYTDSIMDSFRTIVEKYGKADRPIGISLTGGYDSRMLMACLVMKPGEYPCYTFGSMYRETYDVKIAREVAKKCQQDHTTIVLDKEFLNNFPQYIEDAVSRSDGYLGLSGAAELYVNSMARNISTIRLTGNYGSELLRGTRAFKAIMPKTEFLTPDLQPYLIKGQQRFEDLAMMNPISYALFIQAPCQGYGRLSIEASQVTMRTPFMDNDLVKLIYQMPIGSANGTALTVNIIARNRPDLIEVATDRGDLGSDIVIVKLMNKVYREALYKGEYMASHGMPQWVAAVTRSMPWLPLEKCMLGRQKYQHYRRWLSNELSEYLKDTLLSNVHLPSYFDKRSLENMVKSHINGRRNYVDEIDKAMTIVLCDRLLFRQQAYLH